MPPPGQNRLAPPPSPQPLPPPPQPPPPNPLTHPQGSGGRVCGVRGGLVVVVVVVVLVMVVVVVVVPTYSDREGANLPYVFNLGT